VPIQGQQSEVLFSITELSIQLSLGAVKSEVEVMPLEVIS
jgi:hypothetical protein